MIINKETHAFKIHQGVQMRRIYKIIGNMYK